jgi:tetratricopeptide (TPR) repeat protein
MFRKSVSILETLAQADKMNIRLRITIAANYSQIAGFLERAGDPAGALREFRRAAALADTIVAVDPRDLNTRRQVQEDQYEIGKLLAGLADRRGAMEALRKSVEAATAVAAMDPANVLSLSQPPRAYGAAAAIMVTLAGRASTPQQRREDWLAARDRFRKSVDGWQALRKREGFTKAHEAELTKMQAEVKRCEKAIALIAGAT